MITFIFAFLGIALTVFLIFLYSPFVDLISDYVKVREERKEQERDEKMKALLFYVNHACRRA